MASKLQEMTYFDLKGLKKAAAFRSNRRLEEKIMDEMERRGLDLNSKYIDGDQMRELLTKVWIHRREGRDYQRELDQLIWYGIGKVV